MLCQNHEQLEGRKCKVCQQDLEFYNKKIFILNEEVSPQGNIFF